MAVTWIGGSGSDRRAIEAGKGIGGTARSREDRSEGRRRVIEGQTLSSEGVGGPMGRCHREVS